MVCGWWVVVVGGGWWWWAVVGCRWWCGVGCSAFVFFSHSFSPCSQPRPRADECPDGLREIENANNPLFYNAKMLNIGPGPSGNCEKQGLGKATATCWNVPGGVKKN